MLTFDRPTLLFVHSHASRQLDVVMLVVTWLGSRYILFPLDALLIVVFLLRQNRKSAAPFLVAAVLGAALLDFIAKHVFARIRPHLWDSIAPELTYSFPSGHAINSITMVAAIIFICRNKQWRTLIAIFGACYVLFVAMSRLYLGVHYPSDILGGWLVSLAWVNLLTVAFKRNREF
ncbi:phosphatase PAP2 family protein [Noviherbaspirillum pedocola]|uniref:Phosphatase PAP2 family protein n=1 Tax=Noviherbaspirillum pedocola TaxID=2801341 RepID=A0A934SXT1_9BURK|nr:phosphatase PAP2 family protein [Noviherbaspirillum pedocola]MBK4737300.1 phosphatase PAP2 family protein [Noviherbaspirillum pedocola]